MNDDSTQMQESIAAAWNGLTPEEWAAMDDEKHGPGLKRLALRDAAAVLPLIAAEVRKAQADALRDAADSVHDNAASPYCLPCHRDDADLLRTIAATIEQEG